MRYLCLPDTRGEGEQYGPMPPFEEMLGSFYCDPLWIVLKRPKKNSYYHDFKSYP